MKNPSNAVVETDIQGQRATNRIPRTDKKVLRINPIRSRAIDRLKQAIDDISRPRIRRI